MANKMVANIKTVSDGVGGLTKKVNELYAALNKLNTVTSSSIKQASSAVTTVGGQYNLTQGNRPGTGADGAHFTERNTAPGQNLMSRSLAAFTPFGMGGYPGYPGYGEYGMARFNYPGMPNSSAMASGMAKFNMGTAALNFGLGVASGAYQMMPGLQPTMDRTLGYYQAGLTVPGISRNQLERATFSGMRGGLSSVGSDAQVAATLASFGYTPGSKNYLQAVGQVGGAYKYLGMGNQEAASAVAGFQSGPMAANLFQYGITTFDAATGKEKTTGQLARELMGYMTGGAKVTSQDVRASYQKGALGANLSNMGFSADQQKMLYQAMIDLSEGRNPDLQNASPVKGNENTFLTAQGRLNASTTDVMMTAEEKMIKGFENAADTIEMFNRNLKNAAEALGYIVGYAQGTSGTPAGKGAGKILKNVGGALLIGAGVAVTGMSFGGATPVGMGMAAAGASMLGGGGTSGFGASFGVGDRSKTGGGFPGIVTAGYGAKDSTSSSAWGSTNGVHKGTDYAMPVGTPVTSAFDGVVSQVDLNADYGTSILVDNINGTQSVYAHLSEKAVKVGDQVKQGQRIGKSGQSGNANGPHLHFEMRDAKNHPVDPSSYISGSGSQFGSYISTLPTGYDVSDSSKKTTSSTTTSTNSGSFVGAMGSKEQQAWATDFLTRIGAPASESNIKALNTWMRAEGKGWSTSLNRATFNPLNTTLDMPGAVSFNDAGVKAYTSYEDGINATIATLTGAKADVRGYSAIIQALKSDAGTSTILNSVNNSAWRTGQTGGAGAYNFPKGGATSGYGASVKSPNLTSGNRTVNVTLKIERASEQEAMEFAKKIKYYLENENETRMIGRV